MIETIGTVGHVLLALAFWLVLVPLAIYGALAIVCAPYIWWFERSERAFAQRLAALSAAERAQAEAEREAERGRREAERAAWDAAWRSAEEAGDWQRMDELLHGTRPA